MRSFISASHPATQLGSIVRGVASSIIFVMAVSACGGGGGKSTPKPTSSVGANSSSSSSSISSASSSSATANQMVGFVLPFDDSAAGITQVGDLLNHKPAGTLGAIKVDTNGHFAAGSERIRFWGVNITAASTMPSHENAEKIAKRLAKFGVNLVRFHHMDNRFDPGQDSLIGYSAGNSRSLNSANLEKLDYFINELKKNGIYVNLNLINSRVFVPADGLPSEITQLGWKQAHVLGFINSDFRNLEKEYAQHLLAHKNPYTNLTYAEDPAVAFVEINNENGIFQQYFDGSMDKWPNVFRSELVTHWNDWLAGKYADTAALETEWGAVNEALGPEKLLNGNFALWPASWHELEKHGSAVAGANYGTYDGRAGLEIRVTVAGTANWHVQLNQGSQSIVKDQIYTLGFWAKADSTRPLGVNLSENYAPNYSVLESRTYITDTSWQYFETTFVASRTDDNVRINFNGFGDLVATVYLAEVTFKSGGSIGKLPSGETLEAVNISGNLQSESYTAKRDADWADFLRETESAYWLDMKNYIKTDLGFSGLVTGTAMMNSFPSAQKQMDFVDAHAYWEHPVFPSGDWDPVNWTVNNISMVNNFTNTISGLAKQRIKGMPFTVSEYQHSSPISYGAEGPLFAAAYGALQDWDAVIFFAYDSNGNDNWDAGYFNDFFSMNAHPTKMANMLVGANIFRRGDVASAQNLVSMKWSAATELSVLATKGSAWNVASGAHLNVPDDVPLTKRFALDTSSAAESLGVAPAASASTTLAADTNELVWNRSISDKGFVTIDTAKTKSVVGFINARSFALGNVTIAVSPTTFNWATVSLTLQEGSFAEPAAGGKLLMVLTGNVENTNMMWTNSSHNSVSNKWGKTPTLIEVIPAVIDLPFAAANTSVWALDETGQRKLQLSVTDNSGKARIVLDGATSTLWYEVVATAN